MPGTAFAAFPLVLHAFVISNSLDGPDFWTHEGFQTHGRRCWKRVYPTELTKTLHYIMFDTQEQPPVGRTASHKHMAHLTADQFAALRTAEIKVFRRVLLPCIFLMVVNYLDR